MSLQTQLYPRYLLLLNKHMKQINAIRYLTIVFMPYFSSMINYIKLNLKIQNKAKRDSITSSMLQCLKVSSPQSQD